MSISASFRRSRTRSRAKAVGGCAARKRRWQKSARSLAARSPTSSAGSSALIAPRRRNRPDGLAARNRGTLDERRGAQARPAFHGGARPLRHRAGDVEAVLRRIDEVPWWSFGLARHLFARERRALAIAGELGIAPPLLFAG